MTLSKKQIIELRQQKLDELRQLDALADQCGYVWAHELLQEFRFTIVFRMAEEQLSLPVNSR